MSRVVKQPVPVSLFDDAAEIHNGHPVTEITDNGQVMGNEDVTQVVFDLEFLEKEEDL